MLKWILIFSFSHFYNYRLFRKSIVPFSGKILNRKKICIRFRRIYIIGFRKVCVSNVQLIVKNELRFTAALIEICSNYNNLFSSRNPFLSVNIIDSKFITDSNPDATRQESKFSAYSESVLPQPDVPVISKILRITKKTDKAIRLLPDKICFTNGSLVLNKQTISFEEGTIVLHGKKKRAGKRNANMNFTFLNTSIHPSPSCKPLVTFKHFNLNCCLEYTRSGLLNITEASYGKLNQVPFRLILHFNMADPKVMKLAFETTNLPLQDLIRSAPFITSRQLLDGEYSGALSLKAVFAMQLAEPYKHFVTSEFEHNVKHPADGAGSFNYLNGSFSHKMVNGEGVVKEITIDRSSAGYTAINDISPFLLHAFIFTEDVRFYNHRGFDPKQLGNSLVANILRNKIVRGGSTITMQLARNLCLNQERTIGRKLEEMLIAFIIEEVNGIPKQRIAELYLNVIEWAPGIYGITEASTFYFSKLPARLSLTESLVLTYIIPRPKYFLDALLAKTATVKTNLSLHIKKFSMIMLKKNVITKNEFNNIDKKVVFANDLGEIDLLP